MMRFAINDIYYFLGYLFWHVLLDSFVNSLYFSPTEISLRIQEYRDRSLLLSFNVRQLLSRLVHWAVVRILWVEWARHVVEERTRSEAFNLVALTAWSLTAYRSLVEDRHGQHRRVEMEYCHNLLTAAGSAALRLSSIGLADFIGPPESADVHRQRIIRNRNQETESSDGKINQDELWLVSRRRSCFQFVAAVQLYHQNLEQIEMCYIVTP